VFCDGETNKQRGVVTEVGSEETTESPSRETAQSSSSELRCLFTASDTAQYTFSVQHDFLSNHFIFSRNMSTDQDSEMTSAGAENASTSQVCYPITFKKRKKIGCPGF
jgi:hypothetical protein